MEFDASLKRGLLSTLEAVEHLVFNVGGISTVRVPNYDSLLWNPIGRYVGEGPQQTWEDMKKVWLPPSGAHIDPRDSWVNPRDEFLKDGLVFASLRDDTDPHSSRPRAPE